MANTALTVAQEAYSPGTNGPEGMMIGKSSTELIGFFGKAPVARTASSGDVTSFVAGSGTASKSDSTWTGASGSTAYTVGDIVTILKAYGLIAS